MKLIILLLLPFKLYSQSTILFQDVNIIATKKKT